MLWIRGDLHVSLPARIPFSCIFSAISSLISLFLCVTLSLQQRGAWLRLLYKRRQGPARVHFFTNAERIQLEFLALCFFNQSQWSTCPNMLMLRPVNSASHPAHSWTARAVADSFPSAPDSIRSLPNLLDFHYKSGGFNSSSIWADQIWTLHCLN